MLFFCYPCNQDVFCKMKKRKTIALTRKFLKNCELYFDDFFKTVWAVKLKIICNRFLHGNLYRFLHKIYFDYYINIFQPSNFRLTLCLYLSGFSFTTTHESQECRGRGRAFFNSSSRPLTNHRTAGEGGGHSLTPHYHFHPLHRHYLDISRTITAESSPLHIRNSRSRTGNQLISLLHFFFFF